MEGIPGRIFKDRNCGRARMVPGDEKPATGCSMSWEEEALLPHCLFLQNSLALGLTWTSQVSGSLLTGLLATGKVCSEKLQGHSNH